MKVALSKRVIAIVLIIVIVISGVNTYLVFDIRNTLQNLAHDALYDYTIFKDGDLYKAKNQATGFVEFTSNTASPVLSNAIEKGRLIYINPATYVLDADVLIHNKINLKIVSDQAIIIGNGKKILLYGDNYTLSQYNVVSGLKIINGTLRVENSFGTTISNMVFENCSKALELANTATWSEGIRIENNHFLGCSESVVFRTPTGNATGSYASSEINRCFFNLFDNAIGIRVEELAEFSDSQLRNLRFWMGENGAEVNQIGLLVDGSMFQTLLWGVVFESFAASPVDLFAISISAKADPPPILSGRVSILGNWTSRINNPADKWIYGSEGIFDREDLNVQIGLNGEYGAPEIIHIRPLGIAWFRPKIHVQGSFSHNEIITVRIRLEFIDNRFSRSPVERTFNTSKTLWLSDDDILQLFPSQSVIWAIYFDAKTNSGSTDATVKVGGYGLTT